jgi:nucleoside-diphosphate-sugar epimerase
MHMSRTLIAGCGFVGTQLGLALAAEGHEVWGLRREPGGLPPTIRPVRADLTALGTLQGLPAHLDLVFFTAAPDHHDDEGYRALYVEGLRTLIQALREGGQRLRRLLFTSSTAVYSQRHGDWVDEDPPTEPHTYAGRRLGNWGTRRGNGGIRSDSPGQAASISSEHPVFTQRGGGEFTGGGHMGWSGDLKGPPWSHA